MFTYEESFINHLLNENPLEEVNESISLLHEYVHGEYYTSKMDRLKEWNPDSGELHEIVIAAFTLILLHGTLTYQAIVGMLACKVDIEDQIAKITTTAEVIAVISKTGLININRRGFGNSIIVTFGFGITVDIPRQEKHLPLLQEPKEITSNNDYDLGNQILGGKLKFHNKNICLDHINRMNKIALQLYTPLLCKYSEKPTFGIDTIQKSEQWDNYIEGSYDMYIKLARRSNMYWLDHKYDTRGRCYATNYFASYQGNSFKKAIVQLNKTELVEG